MFGSQDAKHTRVSTLIEAAWRRKTLVLAIEQLAIAVVLVFSGLILLLLLGTQILSPYWIVLLALAGCVVAGWRTRARLVTRYRVAQIIDRRTDLHDTLSTAWFMLDATMPTRDREVAAVQLQRADTAAERVNPTEVFPFRGQRAWAIASAVAALAFGLFTTRYLVTTSLSLRASFLPLQLIAPDEAVEQLKKVFSPEKPKLARLMPDGDRTSGPAPNAPKNGNKKSVLDAAKERAQNGEASGNSTSRNNSETSKLDARAGSDEKGAAPREQGQRAASSNQTAGDDSHPAQSREGESAKSDSSDDGQPSGLVGKMKQALSSLMAKMRSQSGDPSASSKGQNGQQTNSGEQASAANAQQSQADKTGDNRQQAAQETGSEGQAQGSATEKTGAAQNRANAEGSSKNGSDSHSGIGTQDGEKTIQQAEQLKAMGKLEEIIGKRSADLTGDMTAETFSGEQHLKSQYSGRVGRHADLGGNIDRNEIPPALQNYVRQYMEQVRRQPESK